MRIVETKALENGAHRNQTPSALVDLPEGWAVIPDDLVCENFPFGTLTAEEIDGVMTVTGWEPGAVPVPESDPEREPTALEQLRADVDYIAIMTGVEL